MATHRRARGEKRGAAHVSRWAEGGAVFAAVVMVMLGAFQVISGLAAILNGGFFRVSSQYEFNYSTTGWGWVQLVLGGLILASGCALFARASWAAVLAICFAGMSAIANFFFIPYYAFWAIVIIALDVWVIWSLTRPGVIHLD
jgi:hypothetical protein